jgi:GT2 family glycosyltransferase
VVIGTLNRRWYLKRALASVRAEMSFPEAEIIVVDGGSDDGSLRWLVKQEDVTTIVQHNRGRTGEDGGPRRSWGYFMNLGFRSASAPYICMLSDDCLVVPGAIRNGLQRFGESDDVGAVAFWWRNWPVNSGYCVGHTFGDNLFVNHGMFRREALAEIGFADEEEFGFYHGDGDLALRLREAGWACTDSPSSFVEHFANANVSQRRVNEDTERRDWAAFERRWGHLGRPATDWVTVPHDDPHDTVRRYWGSRGLVRARANRLRQRIHGRLRGSRTGAAPPVPTP